MFQVVCVKISHYAGSYSLGRIKVPEKAGPSGMMYSEIGRKRISEKDLYTCVPKQFGAQSHLNEPLFNRTINKFLRICSVRGTLCQLITGRAVYSIVLRFYFNCYS